MNEKKSLKMSPKKSLNQNQSPNWSLVVTREEGRRCGNIERTDPVLAFVNFVDREDEGREEPGVLLVLMSALYNLVVGADFEDGIRNDAGGSFLALARCTS
jgi:hypothetical protein